MSNLANENGRAREPGASSGLLEKAVEFDIDVNENAVPPIVETPSKRDASLLDEYGLAGHGDKLIRLTGKHPVDRWRDLPSIGVEGGKRWMAKGGNVGFRMSDTDLVIDIDPRNFPEGEDVLARFLRDFDLPPHPFVLTGGGGRHLYFRKPADLAVVHALKDYPGFEFSTLGRYVVAAGSVHPDTGRLYRFDDDPLALSLSETPKAPDKLLDAITRPNIEPHSAEPGTIDEERLAEWLGLIDVAEYKEQKKWQDMMMACHFATNGAGADEFIAWSTSDPEYSDHGDEIRRRWNSLKEKPGAITARTLIAALPKEMRREATELLGRTAPEDDFADAPEMPRSMGDLALARMNRDHFTVLHGGKYLVGRERKHPTLGHVEVEWFSAGAVSAHFDSRIVEVEDGKQRALGSWWVKHPRRRQYDGVVFDPSPVRRHTALYNLWRGWSVEPKAGDWSLLKRLLKDVLCRGDAESFDYILRWAAFMVQKPDVPAEVALVFKGAKGVGKGTFGRALKSLAGMHGKQVAQAEHFVGRFNEHLMDCILLFVDEGYWAGDPKAAGALKNLITEPVLSFEPKGRPIVSGPNMLHVVIASNEDWIVPASADERRFAVFEADAEARRRLRATR
ncbi:MAG: DUF5906 domain-containing protein [Variibacter sp.]